MPAVSGTDRGNVAGVPRCPEPVMNCSPDRAPPEREIARPLVPCDEEQQSIAA